MGTALIRTQRTEFPVYGNRALGTQAQVGHGTSIYLRPVLSFLTSVAFLGMFGILFFFAPSLDRQSIA